jgi:hypothetical protein
MDNPFVVQMQPGNKWGVICKGVWLPTFPNNCLLVTFEYDGGKGKGKADKLANALNKEFSKIVLE